MLAECREDKRARLLSSLIPNNTELIGTVIEAIVSETRSTTKQPAGRPQDDRVTEALYDATLEELSRNGFEGTTLAAIAAGAKSSKQAVYRRFGDKTELVAAAVESRLAGIRILPPQRGNVAADLRQCLTAIVSALQTSPLGGALRALVSARHIPALAAVLTDAETSQRLVLRQILIATPFEVDMETRIDLLLGLVYFRLLIRSRELAETDIEAAIYLVLGLVAPRDPLPNEGLPGI